MKNRWLDIDKEGLRKSLGQKDKVFLLTEMVSNAWDEDITRVRSAENPALIAQIMCSIAAAEL
jgi:hypothetical protein